MDPQTSTVAEQPASLSTVLLAYFKDVEAGRRPDHEELLARHPHLAGELAALLDAQERLSTFFEPLRVTTPAGPDTPAAPPASFGDYQVERKLGQGAMGVVYKAWDAKLQRDVALKIIRSASLDDPKERARVEAAEARAVARVQHPYIVQVFEVGEHQGMPFLALEYVPGGNLAEQIRGNPWEARRAAAMVERLARAVSHAHEHGVVHRDLKPGNVLLTATGEPKLTDFGLAKRIDTDADLTRTGTICGTPSYMAPEQAAGKAREIGPAADVWALGAILYELVTGLPPFRGATVLDTLDQVRTADPVPPARLVGRLPRDLETICLKCLRKEPDQRYATAADLAADLGRFQRGEPIKARPVGWAERAWKWVRRNPATGVLLAATVLFLLLLSGGALTAAGLWRTQRDAAVAAEGRAEQRKKEAEAARDDALQMLFAALKSVPGDVRATRLRGDPGAYFAGMPRLRETLDKARELNAPGEVVHATRNEMTNLLTVSDTEVVREWDGLPEGSTEFTLDPRLERYVLVVNGRRSLRRVSDGGTVFEFPDLPLPIPNTRFSPDGRKFAHTAGGENPRVVCWSLDGPPKKPLWEAGEAFVAQFTPDGKQVLVSGPPTDPKAKTRLLDAETGQEVRTFEQGALAFGFPVHPGRPWVALWRLGQPFRVVDYRTGAEVGKVGLGYSLAQNVSWHPTRPVLAATAADQRIHLFDVTSGKDIGPTPEGSAPEGTVVQFSPSGDHLLATDWNGAVRLWDVATGSLILLYPTQRSLITAGFGPEGRAYWVVPEGKRCRLLRVRLGEGLRVVSGSSGQAVRSRDPSSSVFDPDGRLFASRSVDGACTLFNAVTGTELAALPTDCAPIRFERPGGALFTNHRSRGIERWPVHFEGGGRCRVGPPERVAPAGGNVWSGLSADGSVIAVPAVGTEIGTRVLIRGKPARSVIAGPQHDVRFCDVSADGRWLVAGSHVVGKVQVYDARTGEPFARLLGDGGMGRFSPDGGWVFVWGFRGQRKLVRVGTWTDHRAVRGHEVCFSPDGRLLAVGEGKGIVRLEDTETGREVARLEVTDATRQIPIAFSPDGSRFYASGESNGSLYIWDLRLIRSRLKEMKADWDWPEIPPAAAVDPVTAVEVLTGNPDYERAIPHLQKADFDQAIPLLEKAVNADPNFIAAQLDLGFAYNKKRAFDKAIPCFKKVIELDENNVKAHNNLGFAYSGKGLYEDAILCFKKVLAIDEKHADALNNLGAAYNDKGLYEDAIPCFKKVLAIDEKHPSALNNLGFTYIALGLYDQGIPCLKKAVEIPPKSAICLDNLAVALRDVGEFTPACDALKEALALTKETAPPYQRWKRKLEELEALLRLERELPDIAKGERKPANFQEGIRFAKLCRFKQHYGAALRLYEQAFAGDPDAAKKLGAGDLTILARTALLASAGKGSDPPPEADRPKYRAKALAWLQHLVKTQREALEKDFNANRNSCQINLHVLLQHKDLAPVRPPALNNFPAAERKEWESFWDEVETLLEKSERAAPDPSPRQNP
jgi:tetratricopeptide (TPR) repeat protein/WD40 repeat protein/tRNA A-37 threonylcarbamoyl transferase component Bud32